jgi:hypothetical protein
MKAECRSEDRRRGPESHKKNGREKAAVDPVGQAPRDPSAADAEAKADAVKAGRSQSQPVAVIKRPTRQADPGLCSLAAILRRSSPEGIWGSRVSGISWFNQMVFLAIRVDPCPSVVDTSPSGHSVKLGQSASNRWVRRSLTLPAKLFATTLKSMVCKITGAPCGQTGSKSVKAGLSAVAVAAKAGQTDMMPFFEVGAGEGNRTLMSISAASAFVSSCKSNTSEHA